MICDSPFEELQLDGAVNAKNCCGVWTSVRPHVSGLRPWDVWNHPEIQALRRRILDGDYSTCSWLTPCSKKAAGHLQERKSDWSPIMSRGPSRLLFETSRACQLKCPSCRPAGRLPPLPEAEAQEKMLELAAEFLPAAEWLTMSPWGDVFVQPSAMRLLSQTTRAAFPRLKIDLFTNGLLLPSRWEGIADCPLHRLQISIDAATAETYETLRVGGRWADLLTAIAFAKQLRQSGRIAELQWNFVVQAENFREILPFIDMADDYAVDVIHFAKLVKMWHHSEQWFADNTARGPEYEEIVARIPRTSRIIATTLGI